MSLLCALISRSRLLTISSIWRSSSRSASVLAGNNLVHFSSGKASNNDVVALDPGTRNFAYCRISPSGKVVGWGRIDILAGRDDIAASGIITIGAVHKFSKQPAFAGAKLVAIERQMKGATKRVEDWLHAFFVERGSQCVIVLPGMVKRFHDSRGRNYDENKLKAVEKCHALLETVEERNYFAEVKKKDDLADAYLMAKYAVSAKFAADVSRSQTASKRYSDKIVSQRDHAASLIEERKVAKAARQAAKAAEQAAKEARKALRKTKGSKSNSARIKTKATSLIEGAAAQKKTKSAAKLIRTPKKHKKLKMTVKGTSTANKQKKTNTKTKTKTKTKKPEKSKTPIT